MLFGIIVLLLAAYAGNLISIFSGLPVPGAVFGILLVLVYLAVYKKVPQSLKTVSYGLLKYLALFYVPAGVGLISYLDLLAQNWGKILIALLVSSILTICFVSLLLEKMIKRIEAKHNNANQNEKCISKNGDGQ